MEIGMFENILGFFKKKKNEQIEGKTNKDEAKERLHLVLMQDRANVSADFLDMMKQEIIDVIKKYIDVDEKEIDVRLTNKQNNDGTTGAPALYANIPIKSIKNETRKIANKDLDKINGKIDGEEESNIVEISNTSETLEEKEEITEEVIKEDSKSNNQEEKIKEIKEDVKKTEEKDNNLDNEKEIEKEENKQETDKQESKPKTSKGKKNKSKAKKSK